jgi:predicted DNA-binding mobile mystery protein A
MVEVFMARMPDHKLALRLDEQLLDANLSTALRPPHQGWARTVRHVLGLGTVELAHKLGISQPAVTKLEKNEATERITLGKLRELADAMDCDLVYGFVPRTPFADTAAGRIDEILASRAAR